MHSQSSGGDGDGDGGFDGTGEPVGGELTSSLSSTLLIIASVFWPISTDSKGSDDDSSDTVLSTNVLESTSSSDVGYSAVQTSQNRSRMSEATPPLPPLPHCVAVGKYRQKV